ncbi:ABC transporter permease [Paracoccus sp. (in: a-proteobacteria)]|uniref:ABC transporter permease n=1 Tax=Paracoccus sp. TaxID=267 RepID=UPI0035AE8A24
MTALARRAGPVLLLLLLWQLAATATGGQFLLAGPAEVAAWLSDNPGLVGRALSVTLASAAWGFLAGNLAAILLVAAAMLWPPVLGLLTGLALIVFCLPLIATGPILRVMMGPGDGPQVVLAALAVYYTTLIPLLAGLRAVPSAWIDLVACLGRGHLAQLVHVRARAALPYLVAGMQIAAPAAFLGAMVGEFTGAERGMGVLTVRFIRDLNTAALWSLASIAALVSIAVYLGVGAAGRFLRLERPPVILSPPRLPQGSAGRRLGRAVLLAGATLVLWWGGMEALGLNPFFAKRPPDLFAALFLAPDAGATWQALLQAAAQTAVFVLPGYLAGLALGTGLAVALSLVVLLLGQGALGTIALVALMVFFPTFVACQHGLQQAPGQILDILRSHGAGRVSQMRHVRLPAMLPAFFASARMGVPAAILAVTVVEWLATGRGLGNLMTLSAALSDYTMLWLTVVLVTLASVLCHGGVAWIERRVLRLYAPEQVEG